jgi:type IV pilus assembly protein PilC
MLRQISTYLEREEEIAKRVRGALAYPSFVILLAFGVIGVLMSTALPALVTLFDEFDGDLPFATRLLIAMTNFTSAYRLQLLCAVGGVIGGGAYVLGKPQGKHLIDRVMLWVPVLRAVTINANAARFSRTLAILLRAGLPLTEIMDQVVRTTDNSVLRRKVDDVRRRLLDGEGLSGPMAAAGCYPDMLVQMVSVGEETGTLDGNLDITAEFFSKEVDQKVDALTGMLTPALTLVIGLIVGFIALSLVMPMYQLIGNINETPGGAPP